MQALGKIKKTISQIKEKFPDNTRYYLETGLGLFLLLSTAGTLLVPPTSIISGLTYLIMALYTIPDIRYRILYKLKIRPPKYTLPTILILGLLIGGTFGPERTEPQATQGNQGIADFNTISNNIQIDANQQAKTVTATATVENIGTMPGNYTVGLSQDSDLLDSDTRNIEPRESIEYTFTADIQEEGDHDMRLYSSSSNQLEDQENREFSIEETVTVPYYLNRENVKIAVQSYSAITQKDLRDIRNIEITETQRGREVQIKNHADNTYDLFNVMKTASANSYFATKRIYQEFENIAYVATETTTDYTHPNGTIEEKTMLQTGLRQQDAQKINWENTTENFRSDYSYWLNQTTTYQINQQLCQGLSKDTNCIK